MARPRSTQPPRYCLHKASGRGYATINGKEVYFPGPYNSDESRSAYDRAIAQWLNAGRQIIEPQVENGITISTMIAAYRQHAEAYYRHADGTPTSELARIRGALGIVRRLYGSTPAADFGPLKLQAVQREMIHTGWCRKQINKQTTRIKTAFKWASAQEMIPPSVYHGLMAVSGLKAGRTSARETGPIRPVPEAHIAAVLPHLSKQVQTMIRVQLLTGMRPGELCTMRTCDIDMSSEKVWIYRPEHHKTEHHGHTREVRIGPKAQDELRPFLKPDLAAYLFSPAEAEASRHKQQREARERPPQPSQVLRAQRSRRRVRQRAPGDQYTVDSYRRAIQRACEKAFAMPGEIKWSVNDQPFPGDSQQEVERKAQVRKDKAAKRKAWRAEHLWHPHQLRHNAATRLRRAYGIEAARIILGHRSAAVTEIYAEADLQRATQIMAEVG